MSNGVRTHSPIVGDALAARLRSFKRPEPVVAPLLAHEALKCPRRIGYRLFGVQPDIRYTRAELARFKDGDYVDAVASEVYARELNARVQVPFNWLPDVPLKGKCDAGYRDGRKVVIETKSQNEKGWSRAVGSWEGVPAAPKVEWVVQAGLAACSPPINADAVHIVLVDNDRFEVAEWLIGVDDPIELPDAGPDSVSVRSLTLAEVGRQAQLLTCCEGGTLPPRDVPGFGIVASPPARDEIGDPWQCKFCPFQPSCSKLDAGPVHDFGEMVA